MPSVAATTAQSAICRRTRHAAASPRLGQSLLAVEDPRRTVDDGGEDGERTAHSEQTQDGEYREARMLSEHIEALGRNVETTSVLGGYGAGYSLS